MSDFYNEATASAREERHALLSVAIEVPTEEQIVKITAEADYDYQPRASLVVRWEPKSYRIEGGEYGNVETDFIPITRNLRDEDDNSVGLTLEEREAVRQNGWRGLKDASRVDQRKVLPIPRGKTTRNPYARAMKRFQTAGIDLGVDDDGSVTGVPGQLYAKNAGTIFITESVQDDFPTWDSTLNKGRGGWNEEGYQKWMRYPTKADPNYVAPPEDELPVRVIEARDDGGTSNPAPTTAGNAGGGLNVEKLTNGARTMGIIGANAGDFQDENTQRALIARAPGKGVPEFAALSGKIADGGIVTFLEKVGAVTVDESGLIGEPA